MCPVQLQARSHTRVMDYDDARKMFLPKGCGCIGFLSLMHKKIPDSYSKREGGNPRNSGFLFHQYMVLHYPRTVWKNSQTEHKVTCKAYNFGGEGRGGGVETPNLHEEGQKEKKEKENPLRNEALS